MRPPISYYGGKQNMLRHILPLIPEHRCYVEPFFGGGVVFFAKPKSKIEVVNDTLDILINFYRVAQTCYDKLSREVECYLYSRRQYLEAKDIVLGKIQVDDVKRAAAWWYYINTTINHKIHGSMRFSGKEDKDIFTTNNKKQRLLSGEIVARLESVMIDCQDALRIIDLYDTPDTFFYVDPPYFNSDMGHYKGYTEADFSALIDKLEGIRGKFLLSCYPNSIIQNAINRRRWAFKKYTMSVAANSHTGSRKMKTECLIYNYSFVGEQMILL